MIYIDPGSYEYIFSAGDLVFDIGACIGQMTEWYLHRGARVITVEPELGDVAKLRERFGDNDQVTIVHKAVGEKNGSSHLYIHGGACSISTFVPKVWWGKDSAFNGTDGTGWEEVEMVTLDTLISEYGMPQFIKMDIEGYEAQALEGLTQPVPFVQFEVCVATMKSGDVKRCFDRILEISPGAKFNYFLYEGPTFMIENWDSWVTVEEVLDAFDEEASKDRLFWGNGFARMID